MKNLKLGVFLAVIVVLVLTYVRYSLYPSNQSVVKSQTIKNVAVKPIMPAPSTPMIAHRTFEHPLGRQEQYPVQRCHFAAPDE